MSTETGGDVRPVSRTNTDAQTLERMAWRNWLQLSGVMIVVVVGLAIALRSQLESQISKVWPWANTQTVLLVGLSLLVLTFVAYLTHQQRMVTRMRARLERVQQEAQADAERSYHRLAALAKVSRIMGVETELQAVFAHITKMCVEHFEAEWASLMLHEPDTQELVVRAASGTKDMPEVVGARKKLGEGISGWVAQHGRPLVLGPSTDPMVEQIAGRPGSTITASMIVPITLREDLIGVINVSSRSGDAHYDEQDLRALEVFADNVGACIRHAEHVKWLRSTVEKLRQTMAVTV
ncbi:MAG: GAF domain-containing protein [Candidatus Krumholzibacteria bacterium]|nr:GAF domain-containing protein [Candidatus Krumholzibacteria bacterium]